MDLANYSVVKAKLAENPEVGHKTNNNVSVYCVIDSLLLGVLYSSWAPSGPSRCRAAVTILYASLIPRCVVRD